MLYKKIKKEFNNTSDLKYKKIKDIEVIFFESLCSSDKVNDYIFKNITIGNYNNNLLDIISGPNQVIIYKEKEIINYLVNGFAICYNDKIIIAIECKADLYRSIAPPTSEPSVNGPKDSFNESIQLNLGLIKRRIRSTTLINEDYLLGKINKMQVSLIYLQDKAKKEQIDILKEKLNSISRDYISDIEVLENILENNRFPLPTISKTERPDKACKAIIDGKIILIADNSPYALILPTYFSDLINPEGDNYVKSINANFLKLIRLLSLFLTLFLPALYISIINYNPETIPLNLLLSFQSAHEGVPFNSSVESLFMIFVCSILRESDIRFPSNYGSSISILGALILGEAAVSANIVSPITIIIIGITFISGLIFNNGNFIDGLRYYRFFILLLSTFLGLYGVIIATFLILIHLASTKTLNEPYLYPIAPYNKNYFFKTILKEKEKK